MAGTEPNAQLAQPFKMAKKFINPVCIQWGLWQQSSGRNEEALGAPEVPFVLGEGTGDFLPPRSELGEGWQSWQDLQDGEAQPPRAPRAVRQFTSLRRL